MSKSFLMKNPLIKLSIWLTQKNIAFKILFAGMIIMLFWAGAYKMTTPGADGIVPLVSNSPFISWQFKVFGTYVGSDLIGAAEYTCALLLIAGLFRPSAGIAGGLIGVIIFFTTSTMLVTTPGTLTQVNGFRFMNLLGLFLFKDVISLGASFYFISYFGRKATNTIQS